MSTWAAPGVKCGCIAEHFRDVADLGRVPEIGNGDVLTIAEVDVDKWGVCLSFRGHSSEMFYGVGGFRPIAFPPQSLEHDIALFAPSPVHAAPVREDADA